MTHFKNLIKMTHVTEHGRRTATNPPSPRTSSLSTLSLGTLSLRHFRYVAVVLLAFFVGVGNMWAAEETITWSGSSLTGVSSTNITAGTAVAVEGSNGRKVQAIEVYTSSEQEYIASGGTTRKKYNDGWWEDFYTASCTTSSCTNASTTARIEIPFTIASGKTFEITNVNFDFAQNGGSGPAVHAFLVQGTTETWLGYCSSTGSCAYTPTDLTYEDGSAQLVFVIGIGANKLGDNRGFLFRNISIKGNVEESGAGPRLVTGITIAPASATIKVGKSITLGATVTPSNATDKTVTWSIKSGDTYVSVVPATGVVTGLAEGTAVITATANDDSGVSQDVTVNVTASSCPTSGKLFSIAVTSSSSVRPPRATDSSTPGWLDLSDYADISGYGEAKAGNKSTNSDKGGISSTAVNLDGNDGVFWIALDCELEEGDVIEANVTGNTVYLTPDCSRSSGISLAAETDSKYTITGSDKLVGESNIYFWKGGGNAKIASLTITRPAPAVNYTVTIDPNGGSYASTPDGWTYDNVNDKYTKSIAGGTSFTAPAGLTKGTDDLTWKDGSDNVINFPVSISGDITFVAQWAPHVASDNANLSALSVAGCTLNETFDPATTAYTIDLPFYGAMPAVGDVTATKDDANAADPAVSISGNVITVHCVAENGTAVKDYTITVTIAAAPTASSSINIEQLVLDNSTKYNIGAALDAAHIGYVDKDALDSLKDQSGRNEPYLGLKFKKTTSKVTIIVPASTELNVKFGYIDGSAGLKVSVNGSAAAAPSLTSNVYTLAASAGVKEVIFTQTGAKTVVYKQIMVGEAIKAVTLPWLVTYDAGEHGTCGTAKETWTGTALTLPSVTPASGWNFDGWNDGSADYAAGDSYTPTANVTMTAQYSAVASGTDLDALTYQIGTGAATAVGYTTGTHEYTVKLPYAGSYDAITVAATPVSGGSIVDDATKVLTVSSLPGDATFTVTDGVNSQLYTVHFVMNPKDGVEIIGAVVTGNTTATVTGLYKGTASVKLNSKKIDNGDYYIYVTLKEGQTFQDGDVLVVNVNAKSDIGTKALEISTGESNLNNGILTSVAVDDYSTGENTFVLASVPAGATSIGLKRSTNLNAKINGLKVTRPMNPVLTAITFNETEVEVTSTTVAATLPNGTNLGTMTVTPTIVRNGAGTAAPTSAWAWGANTYRVTDKDGDYTDYTITLTEDILKHTVTFNTHGGSAVESEDVEHNGYLAAAPADPEKEDYIFRYWSLTDRGVEVDVTTVEIDEDKTFHAVWVAEPEGIKLFDGAGNLNTTDFISAAKADDPIVIDEVPYPTLVAFGSNRSTLSGTKKADMVQYNATTNQTKIKFQLYNANSSAKTAYLWMVEEGATESGDPIEIEVTGKTRITTAYYTFNSDKNRSFYLTSGSKGDIKVLQAKVIESGEALKQFGEIGYSINFNKGRIATPATTELSFEGATMTTSSEVSVLNSSNLPTKSYIRFTITRPVMMSVKRSGGKFYVSQDPDDKGTIYNTDADIELTEAGTWYIGSETSGSAASLTSISFDILNRKVMTGIDESRFGEIGTFCWERDVVAFSGASFYALAGGLGTTGHPTMLLFSEVNYLEAGKPYIYVLEGATFSIIEGALTAAEPVSYNGFYGSFDGINRDGSEPEAMTGYFIVSNNIIQLCGNNCKVGTHRGYFDIYGNRGAAVPCYSTKEAAYDAFENPGGGAAPAQRRRIALNNTAADQATALDNIEEGYGQAQGDNVQTAKQGCYDVIGRRISEPQEGGVYILNGKKVVIVK